MQHRTSCRIVLILMITRSTCVVLLNLKFGESQSFLCFNWNAEPSALTRRAFAIATPKARQVDGEPSATS